MSHPTCSLGRAMGSVQPTHQICQTPMETVLSQGLPSPHPSSFQDGLSGRQLLCLYGVGEGHLALDLDFGQHRRVRGILPSRPPVAVSSKTRMTPGAGGRAVGGERGRT